MLYFFYTFELTKDLRNIISLPTNNEYTACNYLNFIQTTKNPYQNYNEKYYV